LRRALAISLALLLAVPAGATTWNVTNDATLTTAMASAVAGDLVNIAAASYTVKPCPANSGTAGNPIRIVGSQSSPGSMAFSVGLDWASGTRSYISWTGLKFSGDVTFTRADHCSLTYCRVDSGGLMSFGSNSDPTSVGISTNNYVGQSTFRQKIQNTWYTIGFKRTESTVVERCRFYVTITNASTDSKGRYMYRCSNNTFRNCAIFAECWGAEAGEQFVQGIRDSSSNNLFDTDTIWVGMTSGRSRRVLLAQAGSFSSTANNNAWLNCDYRSFESTTNNFAFEFQDNVYGTVQNCVFAARTGAAAMMVPHGIAPGVVFRHCTFYSGGKQAINYPDTVTTPKSVFKGCAFLTRTTGDCTGDYSSLLRFDTLGPWATSDSSAYYTPDSTNVFMRTGGGRFCYAPSAWVSNTGNDARSKFYGVGAGAFADTAWATLDLRPASSSSTLKSASAPSGYYGAFDYSAAETPSVTVCPCGPDDVWYFTREDDL